MRENPACDYSAATVMLCALLVFCALLAWLSRRCWAAGCLFSFQLGLNHKFALCVFPAAHTVYVHRQILALLSCVEIPNNYVKFAICEINSLRGENGK
jgi:hypothetical protein